MDHNLGSALACLQAWYADQCNEDWEHEFGIRIETVDNPGWSVRVDLVDTDLEGRRLDRSTQEGPDGRLLWTWSDGEVFSAVCDERSLERALLRFREFAEQR